jgi:hypothetical protein
MLNLFTIFVMIFRPVPVTVIIAYELIKADLNNYENSRKVFPLTVMIVN